MHYTAYKINDTIDTILLFDIIITTWSLDYNNKNIICTNTYTGGDYCCYYIIILHGQKKFMKIKTCYRYISKLPSKVKAKIWTNMNLFVMYSRITPANFYENIIILKGICDLAQTIYNSFFIYSLNRNSKNLEKHCILHLNIVHVSD